MLAVPVKQLGRKRSCPDARGVRLDDTEHVIEHARAKPGPGGDTAGGGVGGSHERVCADVDIEHGTLCTLEHDIGAPLAQSRQCLGYIQQQRPQSLGKLQLLIERALKIHRRLPEVALQYEIVEVEHFAELGCKAVTLVQIGHAHGATGDFVLIGRTDAAAGGADRIQRRERSRSARSPAPRCRGQNQQTGRARMRSRSNTSTPCVCRHFGFRKNSGFE